MCKICLFSKLNTLTYHTNLLSNIQTFILSNIQTFVSPKLHLYKHLLMFINIHCCKGWVQFVCIIILVPTCKAFTVSFLATFTLWRWVRGSGLVDLQLVYHVLQPLSCPKRMPLDLFEGLFHCHWSERAAVWFVGPMVISQDCGWLKFTGWNLL